MPRLDCATRINVICRVHAGQSLKTEVVRQFNFYGEFPIRQSTTVFANAEFDQEDIMWDQVSPRYTDVHVFIGVIH